MPLLSKPEERRAHIENVHLEPRCQCRVRIDEEHCASLVEAYQAERQVPRPECWEVADEQAGTTRLVIVDGFHRINAMRMIRREWVNVLVVGKGSLDEASWDAVSRNHAHGLRRTADDRIIAIKRALENPLARDYTNVFIARQTGTNDKLVAKVRDDVDKALRAKPTPAPDPAASNGNGNGAGAPAAPTVSDEEILTRKGSDGKRYPAKRPHKGKGKAKRERDERVPDDTCIDDTIEKVKKLRLHVQQLGREEEWGRSLFQQVAEKLGNVESLLDVSRPVLCPACKGEKCARCSQRGWVTKERGQLLRQEARS